MFFRIHCIKRRQVTCGLTVILGTFVSNDSMAHEQAVHKAITDNVVTYVANNSAGYISFISTISNPDGTSLTLSDGTINKPKSPKEWMKDGSFFEDNSKEPGDSGGYR